MVIPSSIHRIWATAVLGLVAIPPASAEGNADEGKKFFEIQCIACHSAESEDGGGAQGPSLIGVLGRAAGSDKEFAYTQQLLDSKLVWDAATLDRFLTAPDKVVPGTMMVIAVPVQSDRDNLIEYFKRIAAAAKTAFATQKVSPSRVAAAATHSPARNP